MNLKITAAKSNHLLYSKMLEKNVKLLNKLLCCSTEYSPKYRHQKRVQSR